MTQTSKIVIVFLLAMVVRIINILFFMPDSFDFMMEDQSTYVNLGISMLEVGDFVRNNGTEYVVETERVPLYPFFLSVIWRVFEFNPWVVIFIQSIIDSFTCVIIGLIVTLITPTAFFLGGILSVFNVNLIVSSGLILTDSIFLFLFALFTLFTIKYLSSKKIKYLIFLSLTLSLSILTRPVSYYLIPILGFAFLVFLLHKKIPIRILILHICIFFVSVSILLSPLIHRNYKQFDTISITSQSGMHLSQYLVPLSIHISEGISYDEAVKQTMLKTKNFKKNGNTVNNNPFVDSDHKSTAAINHLFELGMPKIIYSWIVGSFMNLTSSGVMLMPYVRGLPHESFYNTPGSNILQKIVNFVSNSDSIKYLLIILISNFISLLFFFVKLFGLYVLLKNVHKYGGVWVSSFITGTILYFLLITGPILGVKYILPIEPLLTILLIVGFINIKKKWFFKR